MIQRIIENRLLMRILGVCAIISIYSLIHVISSQHLYTMTVILVIWLYFEDILEVMKIRITNPDSVIPLIYVYGVLFLILYSIIYYISFLLNLFEVDLGSLWLFLLLSILILGWVNKIETGISNYPYVNIFRGQTEEVGWNLHITLRNFYFPLILTIIFFEIQAYFYALFRSVSFLYVQQGTLPILILTLVLLLINALFQGQLFWYPINGKSKLKSKEKIMIIPPPEDSSGLHYYFKQMFLQSFPQELEPYLRINCNLLAKNSSEITYFGFITYFIHGVKNWGSSARSILPYYNLIVLASFSKFRNFGRIEVHRREQFFQYLLSLYRCGSFPDSWRELIRYEVNQDNIAAIRSFALTNVEVISFKILKNWTDVYQNTVYRGKEGYLNLQTILRSIDQDITMETQWEKDVWTLSDMFIRVFIGKDSQQIFTNQIGLYPKLLHISQGKPLKEYQSFGELREELTSSAVNQPISPTKEYTNQELAIAMMQHFRESIDISKVSIYDKIKFELLVLHPKRLLVYLLLYLLNIYALHLLSDLVTQNILSYIVIVEFIVLLLWGMNLPLARSISNQTTLSSRYQSNTSATFFGFLVFFYFLLVLN
ncbi:MAG: hypothetical protein INQ03_19170 [Candidatus Heimdallarchaeota archaeon]|nr:hypothetical protein [Candidatus Heimdallarchaeota archaeon]